MKTWLIILSLSLSNILFAQSIGQELGQLYFEKKYDLLLQKLDSILKEDPENSEANLLKGRALVDKGEIREGKPFIQKAIENDKNNSWRKAWGLNYMGMIEYAEGNRDNAKKCLQDCLMMNATQNVSKSSKGLLSLLALDSYYDSFEKLETEHFIFYFQPGTVVSDKKEFTSLREEAYAKINGFFNSKLSKKIDFIVWNSDEDAQKLGMKQLGFARPEFCLVHSRANQTLGHEMTHVISHYIASKPVKTRFINEGISVAFDQTNADKLQAFKSAMTESGYKDRVSIAEAWENPTKYSEGVYYPLAGEFVKRLREKGGDSLLLKLAANQSYANAKEIYGKILEEVIAELESLIN